MKHFVIVQTFEDSSEFKLREVYHSEAHACARMHDMVDAENAELEENDCKQNAADYFAVEPV